MKNLLYIISLCGLLTACDLQEEPYGFYSEHEGRSQGYC